MKRKLKPKTKGQIALANEIALFTKKNTFLVRRSEYLHQQALLLGVMQGEIKLDIERARADLELLLQKAEKIGL